MNLFKKRGICLFLALLIIGTMTITVSAERFPFVGVVTGDNVNIRTAPSMDSAVSATVNRGVLMDVYEKNGDWFKIGTSPDTFAYIFAAYIAERPDALSARNLAGGTIAVELAKKYLGTPYVYGGTSPSGFDCSGFVYYIYKQLGYTLNRTADSQLANGIPVEKSELLPGDIVMFKRPGNSYVHHVGIYVGNGMMIH